MSDHWPTEPPPVPPTGWTPPEGPPSVAGGGPSWDRPPVPGAPPPRPAASRTRTGLLVAIVVVVTLTAGLLTWAFTRDDGSSTASPPVQPETTQPVDTTPASPSTTVDELTTPSTGVSPGTVHMTPTGQADLDAAIEDAARFVETTRGLEFNEPVTVEALDDADFEARLRSTFESEDAADLATVGDLFAALSLVPPGTDLVETYRALLDIGVLGYYDPETAELVVRGAEPTLYTRQTIVHELTHALDDQWFDLDRPELDDADDESSFGFSAIVEGNAVRVETAWAEALSPSDQQGLADEEAAFGADIDPRDLANIPLILFDVLGAPYDLGEPLVDRIVGADGDQGLADALADPPVSSEQVMHPDRFLAGERVAAVAAPAADGAPIDDGTFGELDLQFVLDASLPSSQARQAAAGWGGGRYVAWDQGSGTCVRVNLVMDTATDLDEAAQALEAWASDQRDAQVAVRDAILTMTSCG